MQRPPRRLDRYQLVRPLGRGGQGEVWEALQDGVDGVTRTVALKLLDRDHASLRREARLTALLRHPHLVDVLELGETDGVAWCAMERCDRSLADAPALSSRALTEVGLQICAALGYAHEALELVHLDLKPGNLLVRDGRVKVADLGIARARGFDGDGPVRGTPRYMAPEQRTQGTVDARTDVFALGRVLEVLAAGPLPGEDDATLPAGSAPVRPTGPPPWLRAVVDRCTEPDPRDRYPDMTAVADALGALPVDGPDLATCLGASPAAPPVPEAPIGRDALVRAVAAALEGGTVALAGPPGIGKSCVARAVRDASAGPAWLVDAAEISRPGGLTRAVARALDVPLRTRADAGRQVGQALASRGHALLVLDSVERVPDLTSVLPGWLAAAPSLRVLLTTRIVDVVPAGVRAFDVPPLDPPDARDLLALRARERGVDPTSDAGFGPLADRLDGVPLALELAAGRLGVLSASEVLERLDASMLRSGELHVARRHATLQDALEWSRELLSEADRTLLAELAVFRGPFTPEDAAAVASDRAGVGAGLARLQSHNLLRRTGTRCSLLGPVRDASSEHLERLDPQAVRDRHARWFARHGAPDRLRVLDGPRHDEAFEHLASDRVELEAAVDHAVRRGSALIAASAALAAARVLAVRGPLEDGLAVLDRALTLPSGREGELHVARAGLLADGGRTEEAVQALAREQAVGLTGQSFRTRGDVAMARGAFEEAERWFAHERDAAVARGVPAGRAWLGMGAARLRADHLEAASEALEHAREALTRDGDLRGLAAATTNLGVVARRTGRPDEALAHQQRALAMNRAAGAPASIASSLTNLAILEVHAGRPARGLDLFTEALALAESVGFRGDAALYRSNLAELALHLGDLETARAHALAARAVHREAGNTRMAGTVELVLGRVAAEQGNLEAARAHLDAAGPAGAHVELERARLALRAGDPREALALVDASLAAGPPTAPAALARIVRAECLAALGRDPPRQDVLDALSTLRAVSPPVAVEGLCAASRALGDPALWEEARALAQTCGIRPGSPIGRELARGHVQGVQEKL